MTKISFSMFAGNTKSITLPIKNAGTGTAANLTGCTGQYTIAEYTDPNPEHIICTGPVVLYDIPGGIIQFTIEAEKTVGRHGTVPFDIKIKFPDGAIQTVYFGWVELKAVVTE